jgi:hypothetical protein
MVVERVVRCDLCKKVVTGKRIWEISVLPPASLDKHDKRVFDVCEECAGFPITTKKVQAWMQKLRVWWTSSAKK